MSRFNIIDTELGVINKRFKNLSDATGSVEMNLGVDRYGIITRNDQPFLKYKVENNNITWKHTKYEAE